MGQGVEPIRHCAVCRQPARRRGSASRIPSLLPNRGPVEEGAGPSLHQGRKRRGKAHLRIDEARNIAAEPDCIISSPGATHSVLVIQTDEELMVARETRRVLAL